MENGTGREALDAAAAQPSHTSHRARLNAWSIAAALAVALVLLLGGGKAWAQAGPSGSVNGLVPRYVEVDGLRTRYYAMGHGEPLVLIHGGRSGGVSNSANVWSKNIRPLSRRFEVFAPDRPGQAGRWWLPGTQQGDGSPPPERHQAFDAGFRAHNINTYAQRPDRAYVGYLDGGVIILDIGDVSSPRMVSRLDYHPPMPGFTHTVLPLLSRDLLAITDESVHDNAADFPKLLWFADVSHETAPLIISSAPLPPVSEFAGRGGRFGAHNLHENEPFAWSWQSEDIVFGSFFNAGVRAYDVRNPFQPVQVAAFVPQAPRTSPVGAAQINDVYVTSDGIVYAVDRSGGGLYVLEFEGAA